MKVLSNISVRVLFCLFCAFCIFPAVVRAENSIAVDAYITERGTKTDSIGVWDDSGVQGSDYITWILEAELKNSELDGLETYVIAGFDSMPFFIDLSNFTDIFMYAIDDKDQQMWLNEEHLDVQYLNREGTVIKESEELYEIRIALGESGREYIRAQAGSDELKVGIELRCHYIWYERTAVGGLEGLVKYNLEEFINKPMKLSFGLDYAKERIQIPDDRLPYVYFGAVQIRRQDMDTGDMFEGISYSIYESYEDARSRINALKDEEGTADWSVTTDENGEAWFYSLPYGVKNEGYEAAETVYWIAGPATEEPMEVAVNAQSHERIYVIQPDVSAEPSAAEMSAVAAQAEETGYQFMTFLTEHGWTLRRLVQAAGVILIISSALVMASGAHRRKKEREELEDDVIDIVVDEWLKLQEQQKEKKEKQTESVLESSGEENRENEEA